MIDGVTNFLVQCVAVVLRHVMSTQNTPILKECKQMNVGNWSWKFFGKSTHRIKVEIVI